MSRLATPVPPARWLSLAAIIVILLIGLDVYITLHQPWLGIQFRLTPNAHSLTIVSIDPDSPNTSLSGGDVVTAIENNSRQELFSAVTLQEGGVSLATFEAYNQFLMHHRSLWEILNHHEFNFVLLDGRHVEGHTQGERPLSSLSWQFWLLIIIGATTFLIGVAIWAYKSSQTVSRLILIGTAGFFPATLFTSFVNSRELTMPPGWLKAGTDFDNLGATILTYSIVALLWYYPNPLGRRLPMAFICTLLVTLIWANETLQIFEWPVHAYVTHYFFAFMAMALFAILQWKNSKFQALSRAALQWFLLTLIIGSGAVISLFFVPIAYLGKPLIPAVFAYAIAPLMYIGLAFGIARYRLFDLERWWLEVWLWLGGGLLVIGLDALLIVFFQLSHMPALGFALILAGWIYLPLRQWLFRRLLLTKNIQLDDHIPLLIDTLFHDGQTGSFADRWRELVSRVFAPMTLETQPQITSRSTISDSGQTLQIPSFDDKHTLELRFREQGRRLYTPHDTTLADSLLALTQRAAALWLERENSLRAERQRIMRDLHDDVASRLLTLAHRVQEPALSGQARDALNALRQAIFELDEQAPVSLSDLLLTLQAQLRERARAHNIEVAWEEPVTSPAVMFNSREQINLQRIFDEAQSNAIRHCAPDEFSVKIKIENQMLIFEICNNGFILPKEEWVKGKGMNNIQRRINELQGNSHWTVKAVNNKQHQTCCLELSLPLPVHIS